MAMRKIMPFLGAIKAGLKEGVRTIRAFNHGTKAIAAIFAPYVPISPNPVIEEITKRTPLAYREAEELYNLSQDYDIDIELLISFARNGGNATAIRQLIKEGMVKHK